jgi:Family of unknown function (DUF6314)
MNTLQFFQSLPGNWSLKRTIPNGNMVGEATFEAVETKINTLFYHEQGWITFNLQPQQTLACHREYMYCYQCESDAIFIYFIEDGETDRLFHTLQFSLAKGISTAAGIHLCKQDTYHVTYKTVDENAFEISYSVKGPKKDYTLYTVFKRKLAVASARITL